MYRGRTGAWIFSLSLIGLAFGSLPASAESLQDALALAYQNNPDLEADRAALRATDESVPQAKSGYRPTVQATGSIARTESSGGQQQLIDPNYKPQPLTPKNGSISIQQPLFRGFSTMNDIQGAKREVEAGRADLLNAEQTTLLDAATAYMNVVRDEAILRLNDNQVEVLQRQLESTQNQFDVGELTRTDVAQAEARLSAARSARIAAEATLTASRTNYQRLMGQAPGTLQDSPMLPQLPTTEDEALQVAGQNNPALIGAMYREEAARYDIGSAAGAILPRVDLQASYSKGKDTLRNRSDGRLFGSSSKQITAQITIPFFQGGAEYSRVRQAKEVRSQRQLEVISARRQVEEQVRTAWAQLRASQSSIESNKAQVDASQIALDGVRQEAEVGSRTTLDVLNAEQELLNANVDLVSAQRDSYVASFTLLSAIGQLTARNLGLAVQYYDPEKHYDEVKDKWFGWNVDSDEPGQSTTTTGAPASDR